MLSIREFGESTKEMIMKTAEEIKKALGNPKYRYALIGIGGVFIILVLILGIFASVKPQTVEDFYKEWRVIVENHNLLVLDKLEKEYDKLWDKQAKTNVQSGYEKGVEILKGKDVSISPPELQPNNWEKDPIENSYTVRDIQIIVDERTGGQKEYNSQLTLKPKGLGRRLKIVGYRQEEVGKTPPLKPFPQLSGGTGGGGKIAIGGAGRKVSIDTELRIRQVLGGWLDAWEKEDLDRYMEKYADYAEITRVTVVDGKNEIRKKLNKKQLRNNMRRIFQLYDGIRVDIEEQSLEIDESETYAEVYVKFLQEFTGRWTKKGKRRTYHDYGLKRLKFINDGGWKIYHETWTKYEKVPKFEL